MHLRHSKWFLMTIVYSKAVLRSQYSSAFSSNKLQEQLNSLTSEIGRYIKSRGSQEEHWCVWVVYWANGARSTRVLLIGSPLISIFWPLFQIQAVLEYPFLCMGPSHFWQAFFPCWGGRPSLGWYHLWIRSCQWSFRFWRKQIGRASCRERV